MNFYATHGPMHFHLNPAAIRARWISALLLRMATPPGSKATQTNRCCAIRCGSDWPRSAVRFGRAAAPAWPSSSECTPLSIPIETPTQGRGECSRMTEAWPNSSVSVSRIDPADGLNAPLAFAVIAAPRASELSQPPQSAFCLSTWEGARERERERECEKELLA